MTILERTILDLLEYGITSEEINNAIKKGEDSLKETKEKEKRRKLERAEALFRDGVRYIAAADGFDISDDYVEGTAEDLVDMVETELINYDKEDDSVKAKDESAPVPDVNKTDSTKKEMDDLDYLIKKFVKSL